MPKPEYNARRVQERTMQDALGNLYDAERAARERVEKQLAAVQAREAELIVHVERLRKALENIRLFSARHRKEDWALLILGFCAEGGVVGSVTR